MKKFYLVAETKAADRFEIRVTDNPRGMEILKEFEAENYSAAVKRFSFTARNMGKAVFAGVAVDGTPFHGEA